MNEYKLEVGVERPKRGRRSKYANLTEQLIQLPMRDDGTSEWARVITQSVSQAKLLAGAMRQQGSAHISQNGVRLFVSIVGKHVYFQKRKI